MVLSSTAFLFSRVDNKKNKNRKNVSKTKANSKPKLKKDLENWYFYIISLMNARPHVNKGKLERSYEIVTGNCFCVRHKNRRKHNQHFKLLYFKLN